MANKIEGYWDCSVCRTKAIKGRHTECPNCGHPRAKDTKFYMIEKDNYVDDSIVEKGPDWMCEYCNSYNPFSENYCLRCGSSKEESKDDYFTIQKRYKENNSSTTEDTLTHAKTNEYNTTDHTPTRYSASTSTKTAATTHTSSKEPSLLEAFWKLIKKLFSEIAEFIGEYFDVILKVVSVLAIIGVITFIFYPKKDTIKVTNLYWERNIEIEEFKTVRENDWSIPPGGRLVYSKEEYYKTEKVLDHTEIVVEEKSEKYVSGTKSVVKGYKDLGNGYFEEVTEYEDIYDTTHYTVTRENPVYKDVKVYKTKYYYDIERWVHKTTLYESGVDNPFWPETNLAANERTGSRSEKYELTGINQKDKYKTYSISYDLWNTVNVGDIINVTIVAGTITQLELAN